jgi:hypothetical protein
VEFCASQLEILRPVVTLLQLTIPRPIGPEMYAWQVPADTGWLDRVVERVMEGVVITFGVTVTVA